MATGEPINLQEWQVEGGRLFTCGRPGRATFGRARQAIGEETIDLWAKGLPQFEPLHIVSLLGHKRDHYSEFDYYPFRSSKEPGKKPTFQEWLNHRYGYRFVVHEFPTVDASGSIPSDVLEMVTQTVSNLINQYNVVVVIDSAGSERTARVCKKLGLKQVPQVA